MKGPLEGWGYGIRLKEKVGVRWLKETEEEDTPNTRVTPESPDSPRVPQLGVEQVTGRSGPLPTGLRYKNSMTVPPGTYVNPFATTSLLKSFFLGLNIRND